MKKTVSVSISSFRFYLTDEAYSILKEYLDSIRSVLDPEYADETIQDIEFRIAELLQQQLQGRQVADERDIIQVKEILGSPSDFDTDSGKQPEESDKGTVIKKLFRDSEGGIIAGVASGLAYYFSIDVLIVRLLFVVFSIISGTGFLVYLICWLVVPKASSSLDRLKMRGEKITVKKIEEQIRNELKATEFSVRNLSTSKAGKILNDFIFFIYSDYSKFCQICIKIIVCFNISTCRILNFYITFIDIFLFRDQLCAYFH